MGRLERSELLRKVVHIGSGLLAFLVGWLGPWGTVLLAATATAFNFWLLPRLLPGLLRPAERHGVATGIVSYPLAVLLLAIGFRGQPEVVAAAWGVLAFGDGVATVVGRSLASSTLPWNESKSWAGTGAYWISGSLAAGLLVQWISPDPDETLFLWGISIVVVLGSALLESLPLELDDNLLIPLLTGLGFWLLLETGGGWESLGILLVERWHVALALNLSFGAIAYLTRGVSVSGLASGIVLGTVVFLALGAGGWVVLATFYVLGSATTRLGFRTKRAAGLAEAGRGRRSMRNVLANGSVPAICAVLAVTHPSGDLLAASFVAALAAAAGDTVSSEIGQLAAGRTRLVTTFEQVPPGTEGGVSVVGTMAGVLGAALVVVVGVGLGLLPRVWAAPVTLAAVAAVFVDSVLGAAFERRGLLDNEAVNFGATLSAALVVFWLLG